jgi:NitT/TauT family transport system substrate-binding protein
MRLLSKIVVLLALSGVQTRAEETVRIVTAPSIGAAAMLIAKERGYFRDAGIKVEIDNADSSGSVLALLAQNRYDVLEGGISAGYFNALAKDLPITMVMSRATTPTGHALMLRNDLKDTVRDIRDLKGRVIASNGPGSVSSYEIGKILGTAGLSIDDVAIKIIPFTQYALAFQNKAIDAALAILPFTEQLEDKGFAFRFVESDAVIKPSPITISAAMINTDWAKAHDKLAHDFFLAYLRGVRDYCQAYHGGSTRQEIVNLLISTGAERRPEILNQYPWPARDPDGKIFVDSMLDIQDWYLRNHFVSKSVRAGRLIDASYAEAAAKKLGTFALEKPSSLSAGCR